MHEFVQGIGVSLLKMKEGVVKRNETFKTKVTVSYKSQCMKYYLIKFKHGKNENFIKGLYAVLGIPQPPPPPPIPIKNIL